MPAPLRLGLKINKFGDGRAIRSPLVSLAMAPSPRATFATALLMLSLSGCKGSSGTVAKPAKAQTEHRSKNCSALKATGTAPGQVAPNLSLEDEDGRAVNIHDFCDKTVLLIAGTMF